MFELAKYQYVTDGTSEGTQLVADISPGSGSSAPRELTEANGKLFFAASDAQNSSGLYVTDGTNEGTNLIADLNLGRSFISRSLTQFNDKLYFVADDGENGRELYVSDGTSEGTQLVADINPGSGSSFDFFSNPYFAELDGKLYFRANDGENGSELYVTDGTGEGTQLVADINPGSSSSDPGELTQFDDKLYFVADDGENGRDLYVTNGTSEATQLVTDLNLGSGSSYSARLTVFNNELFFRANDERVGEELFKLTFDDGTVTQPLNPITGTDNDDNLIGTDADDEIAGNQGNDSITGKLGNDVLLGRSGNDVLDGGEGDDTLDGGEGTDTAVYQFAPAAATVTLDEESTPGTASDGYGGTDSLFDLENVIGSEFDDNLTGNSGNNSLTGRGGNDRIAGGEGDDFFTGSNGADILNGGAGSDRFIYLSANEGGDTIADFAVGTDKIVAVASSFGGGLSAGELPVESFVYGSAATSSEQRFIFDDASRELFFDADGSGAASQQLIATFEGESKLSAGDIQLL